MFGPLVITPRAGGGDTPEFVAAVHEYSGYRTIAGRTGEQRFEVQPGERVRIRVINTNNGPLRTWVTGSAFRLLAVDGRDLHGPAEVRNRLVVVPAGGRADLEVTAPTDGTAARLDIGGGTSLLGGPDGAQGRTTAEPSRHLDLLSYGTPVPPPFDPDRADRRFDFDIGRRPGFVDGRPGLWWTVNGHLFPELPMFVVAEGDVVRMTIENHSGDVHPMHLHGHHALVLSRDGVEATGSPWWVDSLNIDDGETSEIAFVADNPGIRMDHCHNLDHAADGLIAHLAYTGVSEPYRVGHDLGDAANEPE